MSEYPDIHAVRLRNLRIVVEKAGGLTDFAVLMGVTVPRVHALIRANPEIHIGYDFARRVEQVLNLPGRWLDWPHNDKSYAADALERIEKWRELEAQALRHGGKAETSHSDSLLKFLQDIEHARANIRRKLAIDYEQKQMQNRRPEKHEETEPQNDDASASASGGVRSRSRRRRRNE